MEGTLESVSRNHPSPSIPTMAKLVHQKISLPYHQLIELTKFTPTLKYSFWFVKFLTVYMRWIRKALKGRGKPDPSSLLGATAQARVQPPVPRSLFPVSAATRRWLRDKVNNLKIPEIYSYSKPSHACPIFSPSFPSSHFHSLYPFFLLPLFFLISLVQAHKAGPSRLVW